MDNDASQEHKMARLRGGSEIDFFFIKSLHSWLTKLDVFHNFSNMNTT